MIKFSRGSDQIGSGISSSVFVGAFQQTANCGYVAVKRIEGSEVSVSFASSSLLEYPATNDIKISRVSLTTSSISQNWIHEASKEICILRHPLIKKHPNVVGLAGFNFGFSSDHFSLFTEYADLGSLDLYILQMRGLIEWDLKMKIAADVASGLMALHLLNIVHNDVKPANVVLRSDNEARYSIVAQVSDFGASVTNIDEGKKQFPGHRYWAAPETYIGIDEPFIVMPQRDVFSYGLLVWHLATEMQQMKEMDLHALKGNKVAFLERVLQDITPSPKVFSLVLADCLDVDLSSRCIDLEKAYWQFVNLDENIESWCSEVHSQTSIIATIKSNSDEYSEWFRDNLGLQHNPSLSYFVSQVPPLAEAAALTAGSPICDRQQIRVIAASWPDMARVYPCCRKVKRHGSCHLCFLSLRRRHWRPA